MSTVLQVLKNELSSLKKWREGCQIVRFGLRLEEVMYFCFLVQSERDRVRQMPKRWKVDCLYPSV